MRLGPGRRQSGKIIIQTTRRGIVIAVLKVVYRQTDRQTDTACLPWLWAVYLHNHHHLIAEYRRTTTFSLVARTAKNRGETARRTHLAKCEIRDRMVPISILLLSKIAP